MSNWQTINTAPKDGDGIRFNGDELMVDVTVPGGFKLPDGWIDISEYVVDGKLIINQ